MEVMFQKDPQNNNVTTAYLSQVATTMGGSVLHLPLFRYDATSATIVVTLLAGPMAGANTIAPIGVVEPQQILFDVLQHLPFQREITHWLLEQGDTREYPLFYVGEGSIPVRARYGEYGDARLTFNYMGNSCQAPIASAMAAQGVLREVYCGLRPDLVVGRLTGQPNNQDNARAAYKLGIIFELLFLEQFEADSFTKVEYNHLGIDICREQFANEGFITTTVSKPIVGDEQNRCWLATFDENRSYTRLTPAMIAECMYIDSDCITVHGDWVNRIQNKIAVLNHED